MTICPLFCTAILFKFEPLTVFLFVNFKRILACPHDFLFTYNYALYLHSMNQLFSCRSSLRTTLFFSFSFIFIRLLFYLDARYYFSHFHIEPAHISSSLPPALFYMSLLLPFYLIPYYLYALLHFYRRLFSCPQIVLPHISVLLIVNFLFFFYPDTFLP